IVDGGESATPAWEGWLASIAALERLGTPLDSYRRDAAETVLRGPFDPALQPGRRGAITDLIAGLSWREGDVSRAWFVSLFDDVDITAAAMQAATEAVATRSAASDVDLTMVLGASAGDVARRDMRDRYAAAWSLETTAAATGLAEDARLALLDLGRLPPPGTRPEQLARAAVYARWSAGAALTWRRDGRRAARVLTTLSEPVDAAVLAAEASAAGFGVASGDRPEWLKRYAEARASSAERVTLIDALGRSSSRLPRAVADTIASEALRGADARIREAAANQVRARGGEPAVLNGVLEALPTMPRTKANAALIESLTGELLPDARDPGFALRARRAVVRSLLESLAGGGDYELVDRLASIVADAYLLEVGGVPQGGSGAPDAGQYDALPLGNAASTGAADRLADAARRLTRRWMPDGVDVADIPVGSESAGLRRLSARGIEGRRLSRLGVAEGPVHAFVAEQLAIVESMAAATVRELPMTAEQIDAILTGLDARRRSAASVFEQVLAAEVARASLWMMRLEGSP
ncbi:MAG: hypothetical protein AAF235_09880, partial [Planctomycetota bacterium]